LVWPCIFQSIPIEDNKKKVCKIFKYVSIKSTQFNLQKCITWPRHFGKSKYEWNKACTEFEIHPRKLNTLVKIR
jgi:hypothetical protein